MKKQPIDTLRDGRVKATIWKNESEKGDIYSVVFSRTYKEGDALKNAPSLNRQDLLKVSRLANKAYDLISELAA